MITSHFTPLHLRGQTIISLVGYGRRSHLCKKVKTVELKLAIRSTFIEVNWWLLKEGTTEILKHACGVIFDTITSGGSKGGRRGRAPPPGGPNSFNFMQFLGNFGKIVCWRPPLGSWRPLLGEILDPPLITFDIMQYFCHSIRT